MERIESLINQVKVINDKYDSIKKINGEGFNIFSILKIERREVQAHSYFIYELLNPQGSHNQQDIFLQLFLKQILKKKEYKNIGSIIAVKLETPTNEGRKIDFTIETSNMFIAIEMKIDAVDQDNQLYDYHKDIQNKKDINKLYYLTLDGKEANESSRKDLKVDKDYLRISFYYDIYNWIGKCIEKTATKPTIREGLVHYRNLIKMLTNQMGDEMDNNIIELIRTPNDMESMYTIHNKYQTVLAKKESDFWFDLKKRIEENIKLKTFEISYVTDDIKEGKIDYKIIEKERNKKDDYFGLNCQYKIDVYIIECDIYQYNSNTHIEMDYSISKNGNKIKIFSKEKILKEIGFEYKHKEFSRWFKLKEKVKFYGNGEPTFELFDDKIFQELVKKTAAESLIILHNILDKEKELLENI